jgi:YHS domain-containing protein
MTASATFHRLSVQRVSASTIGWGRNSESGHATNALLLETNVTLADRDTWFGRLEVVQKTPHDLDVPLTIESVALSKIQGGYTRYVSAGHGLKAGLGATLSAGIVPDDLRAAYGSRVNAGAGVFLTLRSAVMAADAHAAHTAGAAAGGRTMVMVQTAFDPAKLTCSPAVGRNTAATTTYEGKTYYFCSAADRGKFLTDPKMSLSMMPPKQ